MARLFVLPQTSGDNPIPSPVAPSAKSRLTASIFSLCFSLIHFFRFFQLALSTDDIAADSESSPGGTAVTHSLLGPLELRA